MSKKTKKVEKRALSQNEKKTIIIAAIAVAMAIILAVSLSLVLSPKVIIPDDGGNNGGSSSLTIRNGDFAYFDDETDTYPKTADNWTKRTWQKPEDNKTHGFDEIGDDSKVVAGVVPADQDNWSKVQADLSSLGVTGTVSFPDVHTDAIDKNIYMIATKEATTAAIFSQTFSIASQVSAKVTVWLNTSQLKDGSYAVVMFQNGSGTLKADKTEWYAHKMNIGKDDSGWVAYEFYLFNRKSSSAIVVCSVGLGNVYAADEEQPAEGVLFIDDITYETVSANEYRKFYDDPAQDDPNKSNYYIIESTTTTDEVEYTNWSNDEYETLSTVEYLNEAHAQVDDEAYSPFVSDEPFSIFKISSDNTSTEEYETKMFVLESWNGKDIVVNTSEELKDHLHIGFWLRTVNINGNAFANIILQQKSTTDPGKWEDVKNGSFTSVETSQDIESDKNCGWVKYDVYVKPTSATETTIRLIVVLGRKDGYKGFDSKYWPEGVLYASNPVVEEISASEYKNGTGTYARQVSLTAGNQANFSISNGSFSNYTTTNKNQPTNWTPVYAGQNEIYRDGKGDEEITGISRNTSISYGSIEKYDSEDNKDKGAVGDDVEKNVLKIHNSQLNSFGYLSEKFTLSARTVYVVSVMAKVEDNANPFIYVVKDNPSNRATAYLGKIETVADKDNLAKDNDFGVPYFQDNLVRDWIRYYMVIITGDESVQVRLALFNGSIDGQNPQQGTVYYDMADYYSLGTYAVDTTADEDLDEPFESPRDRISFTARNGYKALNEMTDEEIETLAAKSNVVINYNPANEEPTEVEWDWASIVEEAMKEPEEKPTEPEPEPQKEPVNLGLLFSLLASVALLGALLIVVVVKIYRKRNRVA